MADRDRRTQARPNAAELRKGLTREQLDTLQTLEFFRWELRFVRRPLFREPVPVVFHPESDRHAVLEPDGSLNEDPGFDLRR